jgi:hypothetical protein
MRSTFPGYRFAHPGYMTHLSRPGGQSVLQPSGRV